MDVVIPGWEVCKSVILLVKVEHSVSPFSVLNFDELYMRGVNLSRFGIFRTQKNVL